MTVSMSALSKFNTMNRPLAPGAVGGAIDGRVTVGFGGAGAGAGGGVAGGGSGRAGSGARGPIETGGIGGAVCSVCTVTVGAGTGMGVGAAVGSERVVAHPAAARSTMVAMKPLTLLLRRIARARRQTTEEVRRQWTANARRWHHARGLRDRWDHAWLLPGLRHLRLGRL